MSSFGLSGLATGLDTTSIISQLMQIERRPVRLMEANKQTVQNKIDRYRALNTKFLALQNAAKALMTGASAAATRSATSSDPATFSVSATAAAAIGSYTVDVTQLAAGQKLGGNAYSKTNQSGTIEFRNSSNVVVGSPISIAAGDTIANIATKINSASGVPFTAAVVGGRLQLTGTTTGATQNFTAVKTGGNVTIAQLGLAATGGTWNAQALDGVIKVNGVATTSATNSFTPAAQPGVTINAVALGIGKTLTISSDPGTIKDKVKDLVAKYNDIINQIKDDTKYDPATKKGGLLAGDSWVNNMTNTLNRMVTADWNPSAPVGGLRNYSDVGISVTREGTLAFDEAKLAAAVSTHGQSAVSDLFGFEDGLNQPTDATVKANNGGSAGLKGDGIANRLSAFADSMISASSAYNFKQANGQRYEGGLLNRINSMQKSISGIDENIEKMETRLQMRERFMRTQFTAMEKSVAALQSQGNYLAGQFSGMGG